MLRFWRLPCESVRQSTQVNAREASLGNDSFKCPTWRIGIFSGHVDRLDLKIWFRRIFVEECGAATNMCIKKLTCYGFMHKKIRFLWCNSVLWPCNRIFGCSWKATLQTRVPTLGAQVSLLSNFDFGALEQLSAGRWNVSLSLALCVVWQRRQATLTVSESLVPVQVQTGEEARKRRMRTDSHCEVQEDVTSSAGAGGGSTQSLEHGPAGLGDGRAWESSHNSNALLERAFVALHEQSRFTPGDCNLGREWLR